MPGALPKKTTAELLGAESYGQPLDYSFKELKAVTDVLDDVPYSGTLPRAFKMRTAGEGGENEDGNGGEGDAAADGAGANGGEEGKGELATLPRDLKKLNTVSLRLGNNLFTTLRGLDVVTNELLDDPARLYWLDVSHNRLATIESLILRFRNLRVLYFHGNLVAKLSEVDKLERLDGTLIKLTLQANPIEELRNYRVHICSALPSLKKLDNGAITIVDRDRSEVWNAAREARRRMREG